MSNLTVAAVQLRINWLDKLANLARLNDMLRDLGNVDLLLLPETFATGFAIEAQGCEEAEQGGEVLTWLQNKATELNCVIAASVLVKRSAKKVNRLYWVTPDGLVDYYDKRHLFRLGGEQNFVEAGNRRKVFSLKGINILPLVCYDLRFPVWSRNRQDYDLIINVANWPAVRRQVWDILLTARAIENQCYIVGVNRVGDDGKGVAHCGGTAAYDFNGDCLASADDNQEQVIKVSLDFARLERFKEKFPVYLDADNFTIQ